MLAAISTTILSRRSCALTGSAMTSRRRRNSTRGPPRAPRMARFLRAAVFETAVLAHGLGSIERNASQDRSPAIAARPRAIANALCKPQAKERTWRPMRQECYARVSDRRGNFHEMRELDA